MSQRATINLSDIVLIVFIIAVIVLFTISMPPIIIDGLILLNLIFTIVLASLVVYIVDITRLAFFPSVLLVLTLFRIGLSISTARSILLYGDGGEIILLAGKFLIGGNMVVGMIIFVIISVVNFLVITKGAERVSEVVARFTLDGLPGKQMSIDADLKSGNISMEVAQQKRRDLQTTSSLYGSLDGATKFIKGDVIANIIIVVVNLIAGVIIGVYQRDMDMGEAVAHYSILSIGDGILQQIPITLSSIAGGIMVTKITEDGMIGGVGESLKTVILENNFVLLIALGILGLVLLLPPAPKGVTVVYIIAFALLYLLTIRLNRPKIKKSDVVNNIADFTEVKVENDDFNKVVPLKSNWEVHPLIIVLSESMIKGKRRKPVQEILEAMSNVVFLKLGVELPKLIITQAAIAENSYQILINELVVASATLYNDFSLVPFNEVANVIEEDYLIKNELNIGTLEYGYWVDDTQLDRLVTLGYEAYSHEKFISEHVSFSIINNINDLIGFQEVKKILDGLIEFQELIKELLRMMPLNKITEIFRRLIAERVSIRNFKVVLDALLDHGQREKETIMLVEYIRVALGRYIVNSYTLNNNLYAIGVDADLEEEIFGMIRFTSNGFYLDATEEFYERFNTRLGEVLQKINLKNKIIILTNLNVRKAISYIVTLQYNLPVLSQEEIASSRDVRVEYLDFIIL